MTKFSCLIAIVLFGSNSIAQSAAVSACFLKIRDAQISTLVSDDEAKLISALGSNPKNLNLVDESFTRTLGDSPNNVPSDLGRSNMLVLNDKHFANSFDISTVSDASQTSILKLSITLVVYQGSRETAQYDWEYGYDFNCNPSITISSQVHFEYNADGTATANSQIQVVGQTPSEVLSQIPAGAVQNSLLQESWHGGPSSIDRFKAVMNALAGRSPISVSINQGQISLLSYDSIVDAVPSPFMNPLTGKIETFSGVTIKTPTVEMDIYGSGSYQLKQVTMVGSTVKLYSDSIPKALWLKQSITVDQSQQAPKMVGFLPTDFMNSGLSYTVTGTGPSPGDLFNAGSYFKTSSMQTLPASDGGSKWQYAITPVSADAATVPASLNVDDPVSLSDQPYLKGSYYIQLDQVSDLVKTVRTQLNGKKTRMDLAQTIATVVSNRLKYDYTELSTGTVDLRTVKDILSTGKGVCQHYALVYVTVARAMGLPARVINGYFLSPTTAVGHAWIEFKLNESTWWPLEPQAANGQRNIANYFPAGVMALYEVQNLSDNQKARILSGQQFGPWVTSTFSVTARASISKKYFIQNAVCTAVYGSMAVIETADAPIFVDQNTGNAFTSPNAFVNQGDEITASAVNDPAVCGNAAGVSFLKSVTLNYAGTYVASNPDPKAVHYQLSGAQK